MNAQHPSFDDLNDLLDGVCESEKAESMRAHLAECEHCREEYARLEKTVCMLHDLGKLCPKCSPQLIAKIQARYGRRRMLRLLSRQIMPVAAAAMVLAVIGFGIFGPREEMPVADSSDRLREEMPAAPVAKDAAKDDEAVAVLKTLPPNTHEVRGWDLASLQRYLESEKIRVLSVENGQIIAEATSNDYKRLLRNTPGLQIDPTREFLGYAPGMFSASGDGQLFGGNAGFDTVRFTLQIGKDGQ